MLRPYLREHRGVGCDGRKANLVTLHMDMFKLSNASKTSEAPYTMWQGTVFTSIIPASYSLDITKPSTEQSMVTLPGGFSGSLHLKWIDGCLECGEKKKRWQDFSCCLAICGKKTDQSCHWGTHWRDLCNEKAGKKGKRFWTWKMLQIFFTTVLIESPTLENTETHNPRDGD